MGLPSEWIERKPNGLTGVLDSFDLPVDHRYRVLLVLPQGTARCVHQSFSPIPTTDQVPLHSPTMIYDRSFISPSTHSLRTALDYFSPGLVFVLACLRSLRNMVFLPPPILKPF